MNPVRFKWKIIIVCLCAFILYLLLSPNKYHVSLDGTLDNTEPLLVWEFVADFSNMKKLNPTIVDFSIISESGNYEHWEYDVFYTEFLSNLPFIHNSAKAHFQVKPISGEEYLIHSTHSTCFFGSYLCLDSWSEFKFKKSITGGSYITEEVTFECPVILCEFCRSEVMYQRSSIFKNLFRIFKKKL